MKAQIFNSSFYIQETDPHKLKVYISNLLPAVGFNVIDLCEHHFQPYGYTALFLLSESHLAVHTFPEEGQTYIELSSCIADPFFKFCNKIQERPNIITHIRKRK